MFIVDWIAELKPLEIAFIVVTLSITALGWTGIRRATGAYKALLSNLAEVRAEGLLAVRHPVLQTVIRDYDQAARRRRGRVEIPVLVERALYGLMPDRGRFPVAFWVRMVRTGISLCVGIGLLGTFIGLIMALFGVSGALQAAAGQTGTSSNEIIALLEQLRSLLGGMSTAFQASVWGVFGSLVLTLGSAYAGTFHLAEQAASELEHYLSNEHESGAVSADEEFHFLILQRLEEMHLTLETGLSGGMGEAGRQFAEAAKSIGRVMGSIEPVTNSLGISGESLQSLSQNLAEVTTDLRQVMAALQVSNELVPQRMEELRKVEQSLVDALGALPTQNARLMDGIDLFQSGARQLESTLAGFKQDWPSMVQEFVSRTEQAVEHQTLGVAESIERLREVSEQSRKDTLEQMEQLIATHNKTYEQVASAVTPGGARR